MPMSRDAIAAFFARLAAANPEPRTELAFDNAYQLLVAVVLSAQATDVSVNRATAPLFAHVRGPAEMLALGEEGLRGAIRTIGLFNTKARNVIALSRLLVERHGGAVPRDRDALEALPGVGRKTAARLLVDLSSKLGDRSADSTPVGADGGGAPADVRIELREALVGLGYDPEEIRIALREVPPTGDPSELLRTALQRLATV